MDLFPKAKIWIQKEEYAYYTGAAWQAGGKHGGIESGRCADDRETEYAESGEPGRMVTTGRLSMASGSTPADDTRLRSQYVGVRTAGGTAIIASDNMYLYENMEKHAPIAQTFDADSNLKAQDRMKQIASRADLVIPGHDPLVFVKFPKPGNGVARIQ
jgi:hypothetical protein